jgi:hypothetical protein
MERSEDNDAAQVATVAQPAPAVPRRNAEIYGIDGGWFRARNPWWSESSNEPGRADGATWRCRAGMRRGAAPRRLGNEPVRCG